MQIKHHDQNLLKEMFMTALNIEVDIEVTKKMKIQLARTMIFCFSKIIGW